MKSRDSDEEEEEEEGEGERSFWAAESSSEEDSDGDDGDKAKKKWQLGEEAKKASSLPSAMSLLEETARPAFLPESAIERQGEKKIEKKTKKKIISSDAKAANDVGNDFDKSVSSNKTLESMEGLKNAPMDINNKRKLLQGKAEKMTAKERVKNQRLCGQSGITDYKTWKSDEEMRLRQTFD